MATGQGKIELCKLELSLISMIICVQLDVIAPSTSPRHTLIVIIDSYNINPATMVPGNKLRTQVNKAIKAMK